MLATGALLSTGYVALGIFFLLGGMAAASANAARGRVVVGWFPRDRRGLAMGIRQTCQPLGVTIGAALIVPRALTGVLAVACAIGIRDPPRPAKVPGMPTANPYRGSGFLWRIHAVSLLLVFPQFSLSIFGLVWLVTELRWSTRAAGVLVGAAPFVAAIVLVIAMTVTVADNGLAFTTVAEMAGASWAGRALGA